MYLESNNGNGKLTRTRLKHGDTCTWDAGANTVAFFRAGRKIVKVDGDDKFYLVATIGQINDLSCMFAELFGLTAELLVNEDGIFKYRFVRRKSPKSTGQKPKQVK